MLINSIIDEDECGGTIGADFNSATGVFAEMPGLRLDLWDTAGQERYRSLVPMYFRNTDLFLLVFDLSAKNSAGTLHLLERWMDLLKTHTQDCSVILVGTKMDLVKPLHSNSFLSDAELESFSKSNQPHVAACAKLCTRHTPSVESLKSLMLRALTEREGLHQLTGMIDRPLQLEETAATTTAGFGCCS